jgi:hypothetical protein
MAIANLPHSKLDSHLEQIPSLRGSFEREILGKSTGAFFDEFMASPFVDQ